MAALPSPINVSYVTGDSIIAVGVIFPILSIIFVALRFYVRRAQKASLLWDDWLLVPALVLIIGMGVSLIIGAVGHGVGYSKGIPAGAPPEEEFVYLSPEIILTEQIQFAFQLMQILSLGLIKLSFIMFYRRIFVTSQKSWFSIATIVTACIVVAWTIAFFFIFLFYCGTHVDKEWGTVMEIVTYCPNALNDQLALGISDTIVDVLIIALPIPVIARLHLDTARKLMVMGIFLMGGFAVATSIVRMGIFIKVVLVGFSPALDGDKDVGLILFWSMIESGAAVMAACLPTLKFLFGHSTIEKFLRSVRSTFSLHSRASNTYGSNAYAKNSQGSSSEHVTRDKGQPSVESHAMRDLESFEVQRPTNGGIHVQNGVSRREEYV